MYMQIIEMAANSKPHRETARFAGLCTCFNMRKASRVVTQYFDSVLRPSGLKATQFTLLAAISVTGPAPMSQLADHLILDRTTMTRNLKLLVRQGFQSQLTGQQCSVCGPNYNALIGPAKLLAQPLKDVYANY